MKKKILCLLLSANMLTVGYPFVSNAVEENKKKPTKIVINNSTDSAKKDQKIRDLQYQQLRDKKESLKDAIKIAELKRNLAKLEDQTKAKSFWSRFWSSCSRYVSNFLSILISASGLTAVGAALMLAYQYITKDSCEGDSCPLKGDVTREALVKQFFANFPGVWKFVFNIMKDHVRVFVEQDN